MLFRFYTEMSFAKSKVEEKISNLQYSINYHLIRICVLGESLSDDKWKKEIATWLMSINFMTIRGNKRLKPNRYFHLLFEEPFGDNDVIKLQIRDIEKTYDMERNMSAENIRINLKLFYTIVSEKLSTGTLDRDEIYKLIEGMNK